MLCADVIEAPSLVEQLRDAPGELSELLGLVAARVAGPQEADALAGETERWIVAHLGADYPWPGNGRVPAATPDPRRPHLAGALEAGTLTAEALVRRYRTPVFARTGSYKQTARRLGLDRRTVKEKVDRALLETLRARRSNGRTEGPACGCECALLTGKGSGRRQTMRHGHPRPVGGRRGPWPHRSR